MRPEKSDIVFPVGQFKGLTFWDVFHGQTNFHKWAKKNDPKSPCYWEWIQWVDRYFDVNEVGVFMRTTPYYALDSRVTRDSGRGKPPNPPKPTKCQVCKDSHSRDQLVTQFVGLAWIVDILRLRRDRKSLHIQLMSAHTRMLTVGLSGIQ